MATTKQVQTAKRNIPRRSKPHARSARSRTLPSETRSDLGKQAARARRRAGRPGHTLEDRNRVQLYDLARQLGVPGRSKMGKWELIDAIRAAR